MIQLNKDCFWIKIYGPIKNLENYAIDISIDLPSPTYVKTEKLQGTSFLKNRFFYIVLNFSSNSDTFQEFSPASENF